MGSSAPLSDRRCHMHYSHMYWERERRIKTLSYVLQSHVLMYWERERRFKTDIQRERERRTEIRIDTKRHSESERASRTQAGMREGEINIMRVYV